MDTRKEDADVKTAPAPEAPARPAPGEPGPGPSGAVPSEPLHGPVLAHANCTLFCAPNAQKRTGSQQGKKTIFLDVS